MPLAYNPNYNNTILLLFYVYPDGFGDIEAIKLLLKEIDKHHQQLRNLRYNVLLYINVPFQFKSLLMKSLADSDFGSKIGAQFSFNIATMISGASAYDPQCNFLLRLYEAPMQSSVYERKTLLACNSEGIRRTFFDMPSIKDQVNNLQAVYLYPDADFLRQTLDHQVSLASALPPWFITLLTKNKSPLITFGEQQDKAAFNRESCFQSLEPIGAGILFPFDKFIDKATELQEITLPDKSKAYLSPIMLNIFSDPKLRNMTLGYCKNSQELRSFINMCIEASPPHYDSHVFILGSAAANELPEIVDEMHQIYATNKYKFAVIDHVTNDKVQPYSPNTRIYFHRLRSFQLSDLQLNFIIKHAGSFGIIACCGDMMLARTIRCGMLPLYTAPNPLKLAMFEKAMQAIVRAAINIPAVQADPSRLLLRTLCGNLILYAKYIVKSTFLSKAELIKMKVSLISAARNPILMGYWKLACEQVYQERNFADQIIKYLPPYFGKPINKCTYCLEEIAKGSQTLCRKCGLTVYCSAGCAQQHMLRDEYMPHTHGDDCQSWLLDTLQ